MKKLNTIYGNFIEVGKRYTKVIISDDSVDFVKTNKLKTDDIILIPCKPRKISQDDKKWIKDRFILSKVEYLNDESPSIFIGNDDFKEAMRIKKILNNFNIPSNCMKLKDIYDNDVYVFNIFLNDSIGVKNLLDNNILIKNKEILEVVEKVHINFIEELSKKNNFIRSMPKVVFYKLKDIDNSLYNFQFFKGIIDIIQD